MQGVIQPKLHPEWMHFIAVSSFYNVRHSFIIKEHKFSEMYNETEFVNDSEVYFQSFLSIWV